MSDLDAWGNLGEQEEKPRENLPQLNQHQKDRKRLLKYVKTAVYTWPVLAVLTVLMGFTSFTAGLEDTPVESSAQTLTNEEALQRSLAVETVTEWLSSTPSPLPRGRVLAWDGAEIVPQISKPTETGQDGKVIPWPTYRAHRVSLVQTPTPESSDPVRYYTAVVSIATSNMGPLVVGEPSLLPSSTPSTSTTLDQLWPGAVTVQVAEPVQTAVSNWAKAFTSGDGAALKQTIGDPDQTHFYIPLPGFSVDKTEVRAATLQPGVDTSKEEATTSPDVLVARVAISGWWPGTKGETDTNPAVLSYDVLVVETSSGSPRVVAWSGVGGGLLLEPYENWVTQELAETHAQAGTPTEPETTTESETPNPDTSGEPGSSKSRKPKPDKTRDRDKETRGSEPSETHDEPDLGEDDPDKQSPPKRRLVDKETGRVVEETGSRDRKNNRETTRDKKNNRDRRDMTEREGNGDSV